MALIDELKEKLETVEAELAGFHADVREIGKTIETLERRRWDLDTAIAALTPAPDFSAEKETAREQLEREPEVAEEGLGSSLIAMGYGDDDIPSEFTEPMPDAEFVALDEQTCEPIKEAPALNASMQDEREQGYAPVTNPEADAIARAHDYYSPEKIAARNRSVFSIFRREKEEV